MEFLENPKHHRSRSRDHIHVHHRGKNVFHWYRVTFMVESVKTFKWVKLLQSKRNLCGRLLWTLARLLNSEFNKHATQEPSSSISQSQSRSSSLSLSFTLWVDWHWSPSVRTGRSRITGTRCSLCITPAECVITTTSHSVKASSSTSTLGPWYGLKTILGQWPAKNQNVHLCAYANILEHTETLHVYNVHTVSALQ